MRRFAYLCSPRSRAHQRFAAACLDPAFVALVTSLATAGCGGSAVSDEPAIPQNDGGAEADAAVVPDGQKPSDANATEGDPYYPKDVQIDPIVLLDSESKDVGADAECKYGQWMTHPVPQPPASTPAEPGAICAAGSVVQSNDAARVTFYQYSQNGAQAIGHIAIPAALLSQVQGLPQVKVVDAVNPDLAKLQVSGMQATTDGFTFSASWPASTYLPLGMSPTMKVMTTLQLMCGNQAVQVQSLTLVDACGTSEAPWLVSSGETCDVCEQMCEMAPSPILAVQAHDELPLPRAMRASVVPIAELPGAVVAFADCDHVQGDVRCEWSVSGGDVLYCDGDLVVWKLPDAPGPHQLQAAICDESAAAVASMRWELA